MKYDENRDAAPDTVSSGDQHNRREFFNGLGKWSMIVVAAVSFLRGSATPTYAASHETRPDRESRDTAFQRLARKPQPHHQHVDIQGGHGDAPHQDVAHVDQNIMQQRQGQPSSQPPAKLSE